MPHFNLLSLACVLGHKKSFVADEIESDEYAQSFCEYTGIRKAHLLDSDESLLDLACIAVSYALQEQKADAMIVVTQSFEPRVPGLAAIIQEKLDLSMPYFELNSACQGFIEALKIASSLGVKTLIVTADQLGTHLRRIKAPENIRYLFSDAACATLIDKTNPLWKPKFDTLSFPKSASKLTISSDKAYMDGEAINWTASRFVPELLKPLDKNSKVLLHQANMAILKRIERRIEAKTHISIDKYANTSSSSIPLGLADLIELEGTQHDPITLCGFGAGFMASKTLINTKTCRLAKIIS